MTFDTRRLAILTALALGAALLAAPAAQAFTFERNAPGDNGQALNYTDPMENLAPKHDGGAGFNSGKGTLYQNGGLSVQMRQFNGGGSFDQRYNANNLFDPIARDGR